GDEPFLLRCRLEGMHWVIGVEPTREDVILLQGDVELQPASIVDPFYPLASLDDDVVILDAEGETAHPVLPRDIVLFLLLSPRDGVEADSIEVGLQYLLLAKERVLEGFDDVSVEGVALEGWRAYLFTAEEDHARRLREKYGIDTRRSAEPTLHFDGRRVVGVADQYRVFADPPVVNWSGENADAIVQLIIRRERPADDQPFVWSFPVDGPGSALPAAVQEDLRRIGAGRFSVRAYDAQQRLVVSGDFRFAAGLREVRIVERSVDRVKVAFDLEAGYIIEPYGMDLAMEHEEGAVVFTVRPDQRQARREFWDLVEWRLIAPSRCSVLIGVDLERVVSACGESADPPAAADWGVEPVLLTRADLRAVSPKRLWVWVPQTLQGQLVLELQAEDGRVERIRRFRRRRKLVEIPLRELEHLREELPGRFAIVLRPTEELVWRIGTLQLMATCSLCGREFEKIETMWHHIHVCHIAELFQEIDPLEWFERSGRHLPKTVYQCRYCDKGFPDDGYDNANTSLHQHQQSECQRARQDAGDGPVQDRFRILTVDQHDPREIARALVGERWRCRLCGTEVTREQQRDHLVASHRAELIDLC
ncbi:MAG: hypothetical protein RMK01_12440, partial [Thermomicrobium sp.]|nr:hypothetical protein [Thermomicrobium sp.]